MSYIVPFKRDWVYRPPFGTPIRKDLLWNINWQGAYIWALSEGAGLNTYDANCNEYPITAGSWSRNNLSFNGSSSNIALPVSLLGGAQEFTLVIKFLDLSPGTGTALFGQSNGGYWQNALITDGGNNLYWYTRDTVTGASGTRVSDILAPYANVDSLVIAAYSASQGTKNLYLNGVLQQSNATSISALNAMDGCMIGQDPTASRGNFSGNIYFAYIIPTALNASQVAALSANPYLIYEPQTLQLTTVPASSPTVIPPSVKRLHTNPGVQYNAGAFLHTSVGGALSDVMNFEFFGGWQVGESESGAASDAPSETFGSGGATGAISESGTASDSLAQILSSTGSLSESGTASDAPTEILSSTGSISESGAALDAATEILSSSGTISESGAASDSPSSIATWVLTLSESGAATDSVTEILSSTGVISESGAASDTYSGVIVIVGAISESGAVGEALSAIQSATPSLTESGAIVEVLTAIASGAGLISEAGSVVDSPVVAGGLVFLSESGSVSDSPSSTATWSFSIAESGSVSESINETFTQMSTGSITESGSAADSILTILTAVGALLENGASYEVVSLAGSPSSPSLWWTLLLILRQKQKRK